MKLSEKLLKEGEGVLRLAPTWVPRSFCRPGKRIKLHPDDYYVLGLSAAVSTSVGSLRPLGQRTVPQRPTTRVLATLFPRTEARECSFATL